MKITNITDVKKLTEKNSLGLTTTKIIYCTVEVETGYLWWKKVSKRQVAREVVNWYFTDTGDFTPNHQMENLWRAWKSKPENINFLKD